MDLVQIILPLYDNSGTRLPRARLTQTLDELTERFGGATAFTRAPAEGFWEGDDGRLTRDDVVVVEVQVDAADDAWWADYRATLERRFEQDEILIRALPCRRL